MRRRSWSVHWPALSQPRLQTAKVRGKRINPAPRKGSNSRQVQLRQKAPRSALFIEDHGEETRQDEEQRQAETVNPPEKPVEDRTGRPIVGSPNEVRHVMRHVADRRVQDHSQQHGQAAQRIETVPALLCHAPVVARSGLAPGRIGASPHRLHPTKESCQVGMVQYRSILGNTPCGGTFPTRRISSARWKRAATGLCLGPIR